MNGCVLQTDSQEVDWPTPLPLEGVKSRKRAIFEVSSVDVAVEKNTVRATNLCLSLESRVVAVGSAGEIAVSLLLETLNASAGQQSRHPSLKVLQLSPSDMSVQVAAGIDYPEAVSMAIRQHRPHILILSEASESGDSAWREAFLELLCSTQLRSFRGAVLVCSALESDIVHQLCSERWVVANGRMCQQPCLEVILDSLSSGVGILCDDAAQIDYCSLSHWIERAQLHGWTVTRFGATGLPKRLGSLRGLVFHHMIEDRAEFHIRFIFVPQEYRRHGIGSRLVKWAIERAAQMPQSLCRWVSLESADDELVEWYEKFGFTDMSCGHTAGDYGQTWMEMQNVPLAIGCW